MRWSIQEYCARNSEATAAAWNYSKSTQEFLSLLDLPTRHPFCEHNDLESFFSMSGIPPMGPLDYRFEDESLWEKIVTLWLMVAPPLLAMAELWLRLVAGLFGPLGCVVLLHALLRQCPIVMTTKTWESQQKQRQRLGMMCLFTIASSLVLMTDTYYVLNNGPVIGMLLFLFSVLLSVPICLRYSLNSTAVGIWILVLLAIHLIWDTSSSNSNSNNNNNSTSVMDNVKFGNPEEQVRIPEGLYYDSSNAFIQTVVHHWPERYRTYSIATGATPWMPSGDSRTGLPFLINRLPSPHWHRVFLPVLDDKHNNHNRYKKNNNDDDDEEEKEEKEYVALDIAFPTKKGFLKSQPLYLVLHGLNGGSNEEYIRDFTFRRLEEGSTVVVMIARGLMDLPVRG